jgi:hypothetical protein
MVKGDLAVRKDFMNHAGFTLRLWQRALMRSLGIKRVRYRHKLLLPRDNGVFSAPIQTYQSFKAEMIKAEAGQLFPSFRCLGPPRDAFLNIHLVSVLRHFGSWMHECDSALTETYRPKCCTWSKHRLTK